MGGVNAGCFVPFGHKYAMFDCGYQVGGLASICLPDGSIKRHAVRNREAFSESIGVDEVFSKHPQVIEQINEDLLLWAESERIKWAA